MPESIDRSGNSSGAFVAAVRIQTSWVADPEKRFLLWLAQRIPLSVSSDHLTLLGFVSQCLVGVCYALSRLNPDMLIVGIGCLALNWLGDSLDGTVARVRNRQRPRYGFYIDHVTDTIAASFLMGGLAVSGYIHPTISLAMLAAFLMLSIEAYLASYTLGQFRLSYCKFGPTEVRILLALGNIALLKHPTVAVLGERVLLFDFGGVIATSGIALFLIMSAIRHTRELYRQERIQ